MSDKPLTAADYPISENCPDLVVGARGKKLNDLTLEAVVNGDVTMDDLRITPQALLQQAQVARDVDRIELARNFERASEMTRIPQPLIMEVYEMLRPGRAADEEALLNLSNRIRREYQADNLADFIQEAAEIYTRRGLYKSRF